MAKAELALVSEPTAADIIALFEQLVGRPATAQERKDVEAELELVAFLEKRFAKSRRTEAAAARRARRHCRRADGAKLTCGGTCGGRRRIMQESLISSDNLKIVNSRCLECR